ncbi:MAG TPA: PaaI family thioesterase [Acidimicrobiales bacterium]|nr:PaaI family thioesterase [Acidimicrobiales bacterium]
MADTDLLRDAMPFTRALDAHTVTSTPAEVRARLDWRQELCTSGGVLHGGALMALADSTGGACAFLNLPDGAIATTTIESKTNFLRAVRSGWVEAVSKPLHAGRRVVVIETDVVDAEGRLVARTTQSQAVLFPE